MGIASRPRRRIVPLVGSLLLLLLACQGAGPLTSAEAEGPQAIFIPILSRCWPVSQQTDSFADEFLTARADPAKWDVVAGTPSVADGKVTLANGDDILSRLAFPQGVILEVAVTSSSWKSHEQISDSSIGFEIWNGDCHHGVVFKANGSLGALRAEPGAGCACTGDPALQDYERIAPNWDALRGTGTIYLTMTRSLNGVTLLASDGRATLGQASYRGEAEPTVPLRLRLYAQAGESFAVDYVRVRPDPNILPEEGVLHGAVVRGLPATAEDGAPLVDAFEAVAGKRLSLVKVYQHLFNEHFYANWADFIYRRGALQFLSFDPAEVGGDLNSCEILSGDHDDQIRVFAREIKTWSKPLLLSFAGEMNGTWAGWSGAHNFGADCADHAAVQDLFSFYGCTDPARLECADGPERYRDAYRHVHDLFDQEGASNALWVWVVNHESIPSETLEPWNAAELYYPGDDYVDVIAVDGFNWGNDGPDAADGPERCKSCEVDVPWKSFDAIFGPVLARLTGLYPTKPLIIGEFASSEGTEAGQDKAAWIADAYNQLQRWPQIRAAIWFNLPGPCRFQVESSLEAIGAYRQAVAGPYVVGNLP